MTNSASPPSLSISHTSSGVLLCGDQQQQQDPLESSPSPGHDSRRNGVGNTNALDSVQPAVAIASRPSPTLSHTSAHEISGSQTPIRIWCRGPAWPFAPCAPGAAAPDPPAEELRDFCRSWWCSRCVDASLSVSLQGLMDQQFAFLQSHCIPSQSDQFRVPQTRP